MRRGQLLSRRRLGKGPKECRNWIGEDFFPFPLFTARSFAIDGSFLRFVKVVWEKLFWTSSATRTQPSSDYIPFQLLGSSSKNCCDGKMMRRRVRVDAAMARRLVGVCVWVRVLVCEHVHVRLCFCMSAYEFGWGGKGKMEKESGRRWEEEKKRDCESEMERERKWRTKVKPRQGEVVTVREDRGRCLRFVVLTRW